MDEDERNSMRESMIMCGNTGVPGMHEVYAFAYLRSCLSDFSLECFGDARTIERMRGVFAVYDEVSAK